MKKNKMAAESAELGEVKKKNKLVQFLDAVGERLPETDCRLTKGGAVLFLLSGAFVPAMILGGRNFFPLVGAVLAMVICIALGVSVIKNGKPSLVICASYVTVMLGLFLFFLIYGAENFGRVLWWNLIFVLPPIAACAVMIFVKFNLKISLKKLVYTSLVAVMLVCSLMYFLYMSLRLRPFVPRMYQGEKDYLNSLDGKADENAPNVLIILMDDMAYADLSCYSYQKEALNTPNIDEIADGGIFMESFYASAPVCTPSRFSTLTGRYATRGYLDNVIFPTVVDDETFSPTHFINPYQFENNVDGILGDEITIAEALSALGYDTACIGKWNLGDYGEYLPTNQGFDYFYGSHYVNDMTPYTWVEETNGKPHVVRTHKENLDQSLSTGIFTDKLIERFEMSATDGNPFFGFYATPWPHYPLFSNYNGNGVGDKTDDSYIACIEEFDRSLGELFDFMKHTTDKRSGGSLYDNTLIIFTSDNGPGREGVTGSLRGRKNTTFEGGMKVPMLASYPNGGVGKGSVIPDMTVQSMNDDGTVRRTFTTKKIVASAMLTDLFPTILDFAMGDNFALPTDRIIDGVSLRELMGGNVQADTRVHDELYYMKRGVVQAIQAKVDTITGTYDFKYYQDVATENSAFIDQRYKNYLFNLDLDPAEGYNISMTYPDIAQSMNARLKEVRKEFKKNRRGILK